MKKNNYNVIVVDSGTSLDGANLAHAGIQGNLTICLGFNFKITRKIKVSTKQNGF
jgi:hypothetical protein